MPLPPSQKPDGIERIGLNPDWVALCTSRGLETLEVKMFMRATVLVSDLVLYVSAVWYATRRTTDLHQQVLPPHQTHSMLKLWERAVLLLAPPLLIIDHGHFQYNCVMLGLTLWAVALLHRGHHVRASVAFTCALAFKQMALYFAPAFFVYLLAHALQRRQPLVQVAKLGLSVIVTLAACFAPWLHSKEALLQVLRRIFPVARGLYEDKVANAWCAISVLIKSRQWLSLPALIRMRYATVSQLSVDALVLARHCSDSRPHAWPSSKSRHQTRFRWCLLSCALSFFLFSFQVHEKSILLPCLPVLLLIHDLWAPTFISVALFRYVYDLPPLK